jgi:hypothetical protein
MQGITFRDTLLAGLLLGLPLAAPAAAQRLELEVTPADPCVDADAQFEVRGKVGCSGTLDFGDGTPPEAFASAPFTTSHAYGAKGELTATASSGDCGSASATVQVRSCPTATRAPERPIRRIRRAVAVPQIEGILTFGVQPGAAMMVAGRLFGETPGSVFVVGSNGVRFLEIETWSSGAIAGSVPQDVDAICATGQVVVESAEGVRSRAWIVQVPREVRALPLADVGVVTCGDDANENRCNDASTAGATCVQPFLPPWFVGLDQQGQLLGPQGPSAIGYHANCWGAIGDDAGTDTYSIQLKNGWVLDGATFLSSVPEGEGHTTPPSGSLPGGFVAGAANWQPSIEWSVTPGDAVMYNLYVDIRGPACASHR